MPERQAADFAPAELHLLLSEFGFDIAGNSPLGQVLNAKVVGSNGKSLEKRGFFGNAWRSALFALCHPDFQTSSVLAYSDVFSGFSYYANTSKSGMLVGCWPEGDRIHISFPWVPEAVAARDFAVLEIDRAPRPNIPEMRFSAEGFIAFAAAVDAVRMVLLASILQRQRLEEFTLPKDQLNLMIRQSFEDKGADARWLITLLLMFAPNGFAPVVNQAIDGGYRQLMELGLIAEEADGRWIAGNRLLDIACNWLMPLPAVSRETIIVYPDGSEQASNSLTLRGSGPLCLAVFENDKGKAPGVRFSSVEGGTYWIETIGSIMPPVAKKKPEPERLS